MTMRLALLTAATMLILGSISATALAQSKGPAIPFEQERAAARGDQQMLRLLDDASRIPAHRIHSLPVVDGKIGEYADLDNGLQIYFPYGRIERAEIKFAKYKVDPNGNQADHPEYRRVAAFDKALGQVCASRDVGGERLEMRILDKAITVVERKPDRSNAALPADAEQVRVMTATDLRFMRGELDLAPLYRSCAQGRTAAATPATATSKTAPAKKTN